MAAVALTIDVQERTNSGLWVGAVLVVEFLPTVIVGLLLGPLLDRLERRSLMIARGRGSGRGVRGAAVRAERGDRRRACVRGRSRDRLLPAGRLRGRPEPRPRGGAPPGERAAPDGREPELAVGPLIGGDPDGGRRPDHPYAINAASFLVSIVLVVRIPARLLQSERALTRGYWRDLRDGFGATFRSPSMRAVLVAWGIASLGLGAANVARSSSPRTRSQRDFGYGLIYGAIGGGSSSAASSARPCSRAGASRGRTAGASR